MSKKEKPLEDRSEYFTNGIPNPGSDEAIEQMCTCAISDNRHGLGFPWGNDPKCFWMSADCPIHGQNIKEKLNEDDLPPV